MKRLAIFLTAALVSTSAFAAKYEASETKTYNFQLGANPTLDVDNIFGDIIVSEWDKSEVQMEVEQKTSSRKSQAEATDLLSCIKVDVKSDGATVKGKTTVDCKKNTNNSNYTITYTIFAPKGTMYVLTQKFGNVTMKNNISGGLKADVKHGNLTAEAIEKATEAKVMFGNVNITKASTLTLELKHGNFTAKDIETATNVSVMFGNAEITKASSLHMELKHGNAKLSSVEHLYIRSEFSNVNLGDVSTLKGKAKHGDYKINHATDMNMELEFANVKINRLEHALDLTMKHGGLSVENVDSNVSNIKVISAHTDIKLDMSAVQNIDFRIQAEHGNLNVPSSWEASALKLIRDFNTRQVHGAIGSGASKLNISISHGSVRIK